MDKKIIELSVTEIQTAAGGRRLSTAASVSVNASATYKPTAQVAIAPSRFDALVAKL